MLHRSSRTLLRLLFSLLFGFLCAYLLGMLSGYLPDTARVEEEASHPAPWFAPHLRHPRAVDDVPGRMSLAPSGEAKEITQDQ